MTVGQRVVDGIMLLDLDGQLAGAQARTLRETVHALIARGERRFVLNLSSVPYMDSTGLGELVLAHATVAREGGALKLLHLTRRMRDLLVITKLLTVFECHDSEYAAVTSFTTPQ